MMKRLALIASLLVMYITGMSQTTIANNLQINTTKGAPPNQVLPVNGGLIYADVNGIIKKSSVQSLLGKKVDSAQRLNDSTLRFTTINGPYDVTLRGLYDVISKGYLDSLRGGLKKDTVVVQNKGSGTTAIGSATPGLDTIVLANLRDSTDIKFRKNPDSSISAYLTASGVTANTYGDATHVPQIQVDALGRVKAVSAVLITGAGGGSAPKKTLNAQVGTTYTLVQADTAKYITASNASPITISIPDDATAAIVPPATIEVYQQGASQFTVAPLNGLVTVNAPKGRYKSAAQFSKVVLNKISANYWIVSGDLDTAAVATIFTSVGTLNAGTTPTGTASSPSVNFHTSGINLTANIGIAAPTDYEISSDNTTFGGSLSLTQTSGIVADQLVYARIKASAAAGSPSGNIALTSTGASTKNVVISGVVTAATKDSAKFAMSLNSVSTAGWVNVPGDPSLAIRTATGGLSGTITFTSVATANWLQSSGACAFAANGYNTVTNFNNGTVFASYPATVTQENWYEVFRSGGLDTTKANIRIGGLKPSTAYTVELSGSDKFNTATWTDYFVLGTGTTVLSATVNSGSVTTNVGAIFTVTSDVNGVIRAYVIPSVAHSSILGIVNGIVIKEN